MQKETKLHCISIYATPGHDELSRRDWLFLEHFNYMYLYRTDTKKLMKLNKQTKKTTFC